MKRLNADYACRKVLEMQLSVNRRRERPNNMRYLDVVKEDMQEVGAREGEVFGASAVQTLEWKTKVKKYR